MGLIKPVQPVKLFIGILIGQVNLLPEIISRLKLNFGSIDMETVNWNFTYTNYYRKELGDTIYRKFVCFSDLIKPENLAEIKTETNRIEQSLLNPLTSLRQVNLDPGYLNLAKLVLASSKDYSHRICLNNGIYAEVTLQYTHGKFVPLEWTYPDYQSETYLSFFTQVREKYYQQIPRIKF